MIEQAARVLRVEGNAARLQVQRESTCGQCSVQKGCGTSTFAKVLGKRFSEIRAINHLDVKPGDVVTIAMHESTLVKSAFLMYFFPLLAMFTGALLGLWLTELLRLPFDQLWIILFAFIGLAFSMLFIKHHMKKHETNEHFQPVIVSKNIVSDISVI